MTKEHLTKEDLLSIAALYRTIKDMTALSLTNVDFDGIADRALNTANDINKQKLYISTVTGETCKVDYL